MELKNYFEVRNWNYVVDRNSITKWPVGGKQWRFSMTQRLPDNVKLCQNIKISFQSVRSIDKANRISIFTMVKLYSKDLVKT